MPLTLFESDKKCIEFQKISDGFGNSIELPKWGCCSWAEKIAIEQEMGKGETVTEQQKNIVVAFLRLRLKEHIDANTSDNDILSDQDGQLLPEPMIENLYRFAMAEYNRDKPNTQRLTVTGVDAKECALAYALAHSNAVLSRADLELQGIYYVFDNLEAVESLNIGRDMPYTVIEDFTHPVVEQNLGKSQKSSGTSSTSKSDTTSPP